MAFSVSTRSALDGTGATIPGGVVFIDESGTGVGPWIITKVTIDPAGVNTQFVLANNAAKCDISSINGTTTPTGHGTAAGVLRVELPTDGTGQVNVANFPATQAVSGTVAVSNFPATQPVSGTVTVAQATAANLNATVVGTGTFAVQASVPTWAGGTLGAMANYGTSPGAVLVPGVNAFITNVPAVSQSGTWNIGTVTTVTAVTAITNALPTGANVIGAVTQSGGPWSVSGTVTANQGGAPWTVNPGTAANWAVGATGSAVPANADYDGGIAKTALPAAASDGNLTGIMLDKFGRQVALVGTIRDLTGTQTTTISASTSETTIVTAGAAGIFNDLIMLIVSNTSAATTTRIDFRDTTAGTILFSLISVGGQQPVGFALAIPIPQTTAATNWTAQCATSTTDIRIYAVYAKNK